MIKIAVEKDKHTMLLLLLVRASLPVVQFGGGRLDLLIKMLNR